jgi:ubiquinone/menaquinone biosynthesis C-methylase UbiE
MSRKREHPMMPEASHDESARQRFLLSFKSYAQRELDPLDKAICLEVAAPAYERAAGRPAQSSRDVRPLLRREPFHQFWLASMRNVQELMWDNLGECVDRQLDELVEAYQDIDQPLGTLRLDPDLEMPDYIAAFDNHRMPGSYYAESREDDVRAGALFDSAAAVYHLNRNGGAMNDARGWTLIDHILERFPDFEPDRILDMGCCVGHSTLTYVDKWPNAQVYGIDLGAPLLRYAHARAERLGKAVHFSQQNAECTDWEDGSFDLIVSTAVLHETNRSAMLRIMKECFRLLRPGGVMAHLEVPVRYEHLGLWEQVRVDWEAQVNNEPFIVGVARVDYVDFARNAGFAEDRVAAGYQWQVPGYVPGKKGFTEEGGEHGRLKMGSWYVFSAQR